MLASIFILFHLFAGILNHFKSVYFWEVSIFTFYLMLLRNILLCSMYEKKKPLISERLLVNLENFSSDL